MTPIVFWLVLACGVDAGYEPALDGQLEYIIQIEPHSVGSLAAGRDLSSEVPRGLDIRHYRVTVGTAVLPRIASAAARGAAGGSQRSADQSETPGRPIEAAGAASFQDLAGGGGQFVIQIAPSVLADLEEHDLTGNIPAGLSVTRFVVSTNPVTSGDEAPNRLSTEVTATQAGMPPIIETGATASDDDPSDWKAEPATGPTGTGLAPPATAPTPAGPGGVPSLAAVPPVPTPATTSGTPPLSAFPDENPGGNDKPPSPMPPATAPDAPPPTSPLLGAPAAAPSRLDPPGGSFRPWSANAAENTSPAMGSNTRGAPAPASGGGANVPVNSGFSETTSRQNQLGSSQTHLPQAGSAKHEGGSDKGEAIHKSSAVEPVPYLPLAVVTFCLLFSLGVNVYLGWHVMEAYLRGRGAVHLPREETPHAKRHERKASLAH